MAGEWPTVALGTVTTKIGSGATPRGGAETYLDHGPFALIRSQNVLDFQFKHDGLAYINDRQAQQLNGVAVEKDDVLINITGDSVARVCLVDPVCLPARVNQHVSIIRADDGQFDQRFLFYVLASPMWKQRLLMIAGSGATRNALTKGDLERVIVPKPSIHTQQAIANLLGSLDEKIDLNRRMAATLEEMARALFKSWFVDFDPVRAKAEGRDTGLPADTAALFPDTFDEAGVPKGWERKPFGEVFEIRNGNPTIVLVTDRNDLDDQLFGTFADHGAALRGTPRQAETSEEMRRLLAVDIGGLVFTTIQRFRGEDGQHPLLTDRSNVIVIADEAHRTQYGFKKRYIERDGGMREAVGFADYLRQALPHATVVGFTGTPIEERDRDTYGTFGDVIDTYDMTRAVQDNATVPIHYTARLARLHLDLDDGERAQLDALAEELAEGDDAAVERIKGKLARFEEVVGAPERVALIAADVVEHFDTRREAMAGGKGMIVTVSRRVAVMLYDEIAKLRPSWVSSVTEDDKSGLMKVVITGNRADDPQPLQPHLRTKSRLETLATRFKDPSSGFDLVIVRDMWLTGFDAPSLHTLYIDKPMRGHGLMQAIARVNRVWGDKPGGLVVDYLGIGTELKAALEKYTQGDRDQVRMDPDEAARQTLALLESAQSFLDGVAWRGFFAAPPTTRLTILKQCLEHLLATGRRDVFMDVGFRLEVAYAISAGDERVKDRAHEIAMVVALRANLAKYTTGTGRSRTAVERDIRQLLSKAVMADGILDVFKSAGLEQPDLSIFSDEFLAEVRGTKQKNLAVETLRRLLEDEIKANARTNIVQSQKLSERLDETLRKYHNRAVDSVQVIEELLALANDIRASAKRAAELGLSQEEIAFYEALADNGSARELMEHETLRTLARLLVQTIRASATIDWTRKEGVRAKMRIEVRKLLARYGYSHRRQTSYTLTAADFR